MRCHRYSPASRGRRGQGGVALVIALLVFALCTVLIVAMEKEFSLFYQRGANIFLGEQAHAYLRGAEDLASIALLSDYDSDQQRDADKPRDDLSEIWAQQAAPYPLEEGGWLQGDLEDLQGRFNLNSLLRAAREGSDSDGEKAPQHTPAQQQFIRLLQALDGVAVSRQDAIRITEAVSDWLDTDNNPSMQGAEEDYYFAQDPPYRAANQPMVSVSELRAVAYMTAEIFQALLPLVTVWPTQAEPLNIHTAPVAVLRSINADGELQPLAEADAQTLWEYREDTGFIDIDDFFSQAVFDDRPKDDIRALLGESSSWFLLSASVEVAERQLHLYTVLQRRGRSTEAVVRASGSL
jgi:general secretion pathway protein K